MNKDKIIYWGATGLLTAQMFLSAGIYVFNNTMATEAYAALGFPLYLIYPNATAKVLGSLAILTKKSTFLKNLAYAGFFYLFLLAISAHLVAGDGMWPGAAFAMVLLLVSFKYDRKLYK